MTTKSLAQIQQDAQSILGNAQLNAQDNLQQARVKAEQTLEQKRQELGIKPQPSLNEFMGNKQPTQEQLYQYAVNQGSAENIPDYKPLNLVEENDGTFTGNFATDVLTKFYSGSVRLGSSAVTALDTALTGYVNMVDSENAVVNRNIIRNALGNIGYRPYEALGTLEDMMSTNYKESMAQIQADNSGDNEFKNFLGTVKDVAVRPDLAIPMVAESIPQMLGGNTIAKGLTKFTPLGTGASFMAGHGSIGTMSYWDEKNKENNLTAGHAVGGLGVGAFIGATTGLMRGGLDVDNIGLNALGKVATVKQFGTGIGKESVEEGSQSTFEKGVENYIENRPVTQNMGFNAGVGTVAGAYSNAVIGSPSLIAGLSQSNNKPKAKQYSDEEIKLGLTKADTPNYQASGIYAFAVANQDVKLQNEVINNLENSRLQFGKKLMQLDESSDDYKDVLERYKSFMDNHYNPVMNERAISLQAFAGQVNTDNHIKTVQANADVLSNRLQQRTNNSSNNKSSAHNIMIKMGDYYTHNKRNADVGAGTGNHLDIHLTGKLKGQNPTNYLDRFITADGIDLKTMLATKKYVPSSGQQFGANRDGGKRKHKGIDFDSRIGQGVMINPKYQVANVTRHNNKGGYGEYIQVHFTDGVSIGLGHMGKKAVDEFMKAYSQGNSVSQQVATSSVSNNSTGSISAVKVINPKDGKSVTLELADGTIVKRTGDRNWRNHNAGNIEYGNFAKANGAIGSDGRFAIFPDKETGDKARKKLIFESPNFKNLNLSDAIKRYAPPIENNTQNYINIVLKSVNNQNKKMSEYTEQERQSILNAMEKVEGHRQGTEEIIKQGSGYVNQQQNQTDDVDDTDTQVSRIDTGSSVNPFQNFIDILNEEEPSPEQDTRTEEEKQADNLLKQEIAETIKRASLYTIEQVDNHPLLNEEQKVVLRQMIEVKRKMADLRNQDAVSEDIINGYSGSSNIESHLGINDYDLMIKDAFTKGNNAEVNKLMAWLNRFVDNHNRKRDLINEAIQSPERVYIARDSNDDWVYVDKPNSKTEENAFKLASGLWVEQGTSNKLLKQIDTEVSLLNEFMTSMMSMVQGVLDPNYTLPVYGRKSASVHQQQQIDKQQSQTTNQEQQEQVQQNVQNVQSVQTQNSAIVTLGRHKNPETGKYTNINSAQVGEQGWLGSPYNSSENTPKDFYVKDDDEHYQKYLSLVNKKAQESDEFLQALLDLKGKKIVGGNIETKAIRNLLKDIPTDDLDKARQHIANIAGTNTDNSDSSDTTDTVNSTSSDLDTTNSTDNKSTNKLNVIETNSIPKQRDDVVEVRTKFFSKNGKGTDSLTDANPNSKLLVDSMITGLKQVKDSGHELVFPKQGIAQHLQTQAPKTFTYLNQQLKDVLGYENPTRLVDSSNTERSAVNAMGKESKGRARPAMTNTKPLPESETETEQETKEIEFIKGIPSQLLQGVINVDEHFDLVKQIQVDGMSNKEKNLLLGLMESLLNYSPDYQVVFKQDGTSIYEDKTKTMVIALTDTTNALELMARGLVQSSNGDLITYLESHPTHSDTQQAELHRELSELRTIIQEIVLNRESELDDTTVSALAYALESNVNLVSIAQTNPKAIQVLDSIKLPYRERVKSNIFKRIIRIIGEFLGFKEQSDSAYTRLIELSAQATQLQNRTPKLSFEVSEQGKISALQNVSQEQQKQELAKPFRQRNHLIASFNQSNVKSKPLASIANLSSKLSVNLMQGLEQLHTLTPTQAQRNQLKDFLNFRNEFAGHLLDTFKQAKKTDEVNYAYRDMKSFLVNEHDEIDENVLTALALTAYGWVIENGNHTMNLNGDIANLLNLDDEAKDTIPVSIRNQYRHIGFISQITADRLGKSIVRSLGLSINHESNPQLLSRLEMSLGQWTLNAMQSASLIRVHEMNTKKHIENINTVGGVVPENLDVSENSKTYFISVTDLNGEKANPRLAEIVENNKATQGYLAEVFGSEIGFVYPKFKKPTEVETRIRGTTAKVSKHQEKLMKMMQEAPVRVQMDTYQAMEYLYHEFQDDLLDMFGARVTEEELRFTHIDDHDSKIASAQGKLREIQNGLSFISGLRKEKDGQLQEFYLPVYGAKNDRMHYAPNIFNFQTSKVHRALAELANFKNEIDVNKAKLIDGNHLIYSEEMFFDEQGKTTDLTRFFRALAENLEGSEDFVEQYGDLSKRYATGFTVDKIQSKDFLPAFVAYMNQDMAKQAVSAMQVLLDDPRSITAEQVQAIKSFIDNGDMGASSFRALVEYTKFITAIQNNKPFITSFGLGSDGVNNGSAFSYILTGTADINDVFMMQVGVIPKADNEENQLESYFDTRLDSNIGDYYEGFGRLLKTIFKSIEEQGTYTNKDNEINIDKELLKTVLSLHPSASKRKLTKDILIPFGYSAGLNRIIQVSFDRFMSDIKNTQVELAKTHIKNEEQYAQGKISEDVYNKTKEENDNKAFEFTKSMQHILGDKYKLPEYSEMLKQTISKEDMDKFKLAYDDTLKPIISIGLNQYADKFINARNQNIANHQSAYVMYAKMRKAIFDNAIAKRKAELRKEIEQQYPELQGAKLDKYVDDWFNEQGFTGIELDAIEQQVNDLIPKINNPYVITSQEDESDRDSAFHLYDRSYKLVNDGVTESLGFAVNDKGFLKSITRKLPTQVNEILGVGVTANSQQIQGSDAYVAGQVSALGGEVNINIHDAQISGLKNYLKMVEMQNKAFFNAVAQYHYNLISLEPVLKGLKAINDLSKELPTELFNEAKAEIFAEIFMNIARTDEMQLLQASLFEFPEDVKFKEDKIIYLTTEFISNPELADTLVYPLVLKAIHTAGNFDLNKIEILKKQYAIHQYAGEDGQYHLTDDDFKLLNTQAKEIESLMNTLKDDLTGLTNLNISQVVSDFENGQLEQQQRNQSFSKPSEVINKANESSFNQKRTENNLAQIINIWSTEKNGYESLSNLALRPFTGKDNRHYYSVEHAYQTWKSGTFDEDTYNNVNWAKGNVKISGTRKANMKTNIGLMEDLMRESFNQNPKAKELLLSTGLSTLTHTQDKGVWAKAFPDLLMRLRKEFKDNQTSNNQINSNQENTNTEYGKQVTKGVSRIKGIDYIKYDNGVYFTYVFSNGVVRSLPKEMVNKHIVSTHEKHKTNVIGLANTEFEKSFLQSQLDIVNVLSSNTVIGFFDDINAVKYPEAKRAFIENSTAVALNKKSGNGIYIDLLSPTEFNIAEVINHELSHLYTADIVVDKAGINYAHTKESEYGQTLKLIYEILSVFSNDTHDLNSHLFSRLQYSSKDYREMLTVLTSEENVINTISKSIPVSYVPKYSPLVLHFHKTLGIPLKAENLYDTLMWVIADLNVDNPLLNRLSVQHDEQIKQQLNQLSTQLGDNHELLRSVWNELTGLETRSVFLSQEKQSQSREETGDTQQATTNASTRSVSSVHQSEYGLRLSNQSGKTKPVGTANKQQQLPLDLNQESNTSIAIEIEKLSSQVSKEEYDLAKLLLNQLNQVNGQVQFKFIPDVVVDGQSALGAYEFETNTIEINSNAWNKLNAQQKIGLLIHEMSHAMTETTLQYSGQNLTTEQHKALDFINDVYNKVKANIDMTDNFQVYATSNVAEFIAHGMSDNRIRNLIAKHARIAKQNISFIESVKAFLDNVFTLFGFKKNTNEFKRYSAFINAVMKLDVQYDSSKVVAVKRASKHSTQTVDAMSFVDTLKNLNHGGVSTEHNQYLDSLVEIIGGFYDRHTNQQSKLQRSLNKVKTKAINAGFKLSDKEVRLIDVMEIVVPELLKEQAGTIQANELSKLYESIITHYPTAELFYDNFDQLSKAEQGLLRKKFNYVFGNRGNHDRKHRFFIMALVSDEFRQMIAKPRKQIKSNPKSWFDKLMSWFSKGFFVLTKRYWGNRNDIVVRNIMSRLGQIDAENRHRLEQTFDKAWNTSLKPVGKLNKITTAIFDFVFSKVSHNYNSQNVTSSLINSVTQLGKTAYIHGANIFSKATTNIGSRFASYERRPLSLLVELANEMDWSSQMAKFTDYFTRITQKIAQDRANEDRSKRTEIAGLFSKELSTETKTAVSYVLLRSDVSSLLEHYNKAKTKKLITSKEERAREIEYLETLISEHKNGNDILIQAKTLAYYMVTEEAKRDLVKNPVAIAMGLGSKYELDSIEQVNDLLVQQIDRLTTLYAINYNSNHHLGLVNELMDTQADAVMQMLNIHKDLVNTAKQDFATNPLNFAKGYLPQETNPYRSLAFARNDDEIVEMEKQGWERVYDDYLIKDSADNTDERVLMFHKDIHYRNYVSGSLDMYETSAKGTEVYNAQDYLEINRVAKEHYEERHNRNSVVSYKDYDPAKLPNAMVATYDSEGAIINYHYEMSGFLRDSYLERSNDFIGLLAIYAGNQLYKSNIVPHQIELADGIYQDFERNYTKEPHQFIVIEPESKNPELLRVWRMIPYPFRQRMRELHGNNRIVIRASVFNATFGFRTYSLADMFDKSVENRNWVEKMFVTFATLVLKDKAKARIVTFERIWQWFVSQAKDFIVIRNPLTLIANIQANFLLLMLHGINPVQALKEFIFAWKNGRKYRLDYQKLTDINTQIQAKGRLSHLLKEKNRLEHELASNPLVDFMNAGLMSTIVEDTVVLSETKQYESDGMRKIKKHYHRIPEKLRRVFDYIAMNPNTEPYKFMAEATQFSDFGAKVVLARHLQSKGMSLENAIMQAQDNFINYDIPTSRGLDYMNSMGLFMFTKFFLRFQKVLFNQLHKNLASVVLQHYLVESTTNMAGILDPSIILRFGNNPFELGALSIIPASGDIATVDAIGSVF